MTPADQALETVAAARADCERGWTYPCAVGLGLLLDAQEAGVVDDGWRRAVDVEPLLATLEEGADEIADRRAADVAQLRRIVAFGGRLEFEEMMLVLTLRSNIASSGRFAGDPGDAAGAELDPELRDGLEENRDVVNECRRRDAVALVASPPRHWWWRVGT